MTRSDDNPDDAGESLGEAPGAGPGAGAALYATQKPLRECVRESLDQYFALLAGHEPRELYALVIAEVEAPLLEKVLSQCAGNQTRAAQMLGINRGTLRKKLRQYRLEHDA